MITLLLSPDFLYVLIFILIVLMIVTLANQMNIEDALKNHKHPEPEVYGLRELVFQHSATLAKLEAEMKKRKRKRRNADGVNATLRLEA